MFEEYFYDILLDIRILPSSDSFLRFTSDLVKELVNLASVASFFKAQQIS